MSGIKAFSFYFLYALVNLRPCLMLSLSYKEYPVGQNKSASSLEATDWFFSKAVTCKMSSVTVVMVIVL